jgi:hypothetical protein
MAAVVAAAALSLMGACCLPQVEAAARVFPVRPAALESDLAAIPQARQIMEAEAEPALPLGVGLFGIRPNTSGGRILPIRGRRDV